MEIILFALLLFVCALSFIEDRLQKYNQAIYISLGVILVLFAGFREVGFDRDSENYELYFNNCDDPMLSFAVEYSYRILSIIFKAVFGDFRSILLFYAIVGITLKLVALRRITPLLYLPLAIYLSNYYILHDLTQIRASVASALLLFSIPYIDENRKKVVFGLMALAAFFHYSALVLLPVVFLSNKDMGVKERWLWAAIVPLGYLMYFLKINIATAVYIPYITDKIEIYESLRDQGLVGEEINVFYWVFLLKCTIYLCTLFFYDAVRQENKYMPIVVKLMGISIFIYLFFAQMPILSFRLSELFGIVEIPMFTYVIYMVRPQWPGTSFVSMVAVAISVVMIFIEKIFEAA